MAYIPVGIKTYQKTCLVCKAEFVGVYNQKYCGSQLKRTGCAYKMQWKNKQLVPRREKAAKPKMYADYVREAVEAGKLKRYYLQQIDA